jgi:hypothetical protein
MLVAKKNGRKGSKTDIRKREFKIDQLDARVQ